MRDPLPTTLEILFLRLLPNPGHKVWPELGVELIHVAPTDQLETRWERPALVAVIQGHKTGSLGPHPFEVGPEQMLVVHLPMLSSCASSGLAGKPFLAVSWELHVETLIDLMREVQAPAQADQTEPHGAQTVPVTELGEPGLATLHRLLMTLHDATAMRVIAPGLRREMHYLALSGACGHLLRDLVSLNGRASAIWRSVQFMRERLGEPLNVAQLARQSAMSKSLFFLNFKLHTGCSPLQYQKRLRLEWAKELLGRPGVGVATVAHAVGYQSASQFSREFRREFGFPPSDAKRVRPLRRPDKLSGP